MRRGRHRAATVALAGALALTGCGLPTDDNARRIPDRNVPFSLLDPPPPTTTSTTTTAP